MSMAVTILAAGDLHLGRRSKHLPTDVSTEVSSPIHTWRRMVDEAIRREVDLVCLTGDIVDQENKYFEAFGPLAKQLRRLDEHDIPVFLVAGNHDYDVLDELIDQVDSPRVHLLGRNGTWEQTAVEHTDLPVKIVGWSFPARHYRRSPIEEFPEQEAAAGVTVGLLHCDLDATEDRYAPVPRTHLLRAPVDCWLLGHIHKPSLDSEQAPILYPGSPHALDNGEQGRHGPWLVTVHSPQRIEAEQLPLSPVRYDSLRVDISEVETRDDWRAAVVSAIEAHLTDVEEQLLATDLAMCDMVLEGRTPAYEAVSRWIDTADMAEFTYDFSGTTARIYKVRNAARPGVGNLDQLADQQNPAGYLARVIQAIESEEESDLLDEVIRELRPVFRRLDASTTYSPLRDSTPLDRSDEVIAEQVLECSRELLAALIDQKE